MQIKRRILARPALFAQQGTIVATWRKHGNFRLGPYFRLKYYDGGVQRSIYLGRSQELAQEVRRLLADLQFHRTSRRLHWQIRASLRLQKTRLQNHLHAHGYHLKGYKIHKSKTESH